MKSQINSSKKSPESLSRRSFLGKTAKNGKKSCNDFSIPAKVTEIMLLTNIAIKNQRANITLEYDPVNMKITNLPEANNLFH